LEAIHAAKCDHLFTFEEVNIESSQELLMKYQFDIPVVTINNVEAFRHRVDTKKFKTLLKFELER